MRQSKQNEQSTLSDWAFEVAIACVIAASIGLAAASGQFRAAQRSRPPTTEERLQRLEREARELRRDVDHLNRLHHHSKQHSGRGAK